MAMTDDALIEAMDKAYWDESLRDSATFLDQMRAALAVARKAILEEAATIADAAAESALTEDGDYVARRISGDIRSLANTENSNAQP